MNAGRLVVIRSYPNGPRVWVCGQRLHHGTTGALAVLLLRRRRWAALGALALCLHDRRDWRVWFSREKLPATSLDSDRRGL